MLVGDTVPFRWDFTHRDFERNLVGDSEESGYRFCVPLKRGADTDPIFVVTDGCAYGISDVVSQETDLEFGGAEQVAARVSSLMTALIHGFYRWVFDAQKTLPKTSLRFPTTFLSTLPLSTFAHCYNGRRAFPSSSERTSG